MTSYYDEPVTVRRGDLEALLESSRKREYLPFSLTEVHRHIDRALLAKPESDPGRTAVEHIARIPETVEVVGPKGRKVILLDGEPTFRDFYDAYPHKKQPKTAERAWAKAIKAGVAPRVIFDAACALAAHWANEPRHRLGFIPYPATWLNAGSWEDELVPHTSEQSKTDVNRDAIVKGAMGLDRRTPAERLAAAQQKELGS